MDCTADKLSGTGDIWQTVREKLPKSSMSLDMFDSAGSG